MKSGTNLDMGGVNNDPIRSLSRSPRTSLLDASSSSWPLSFCLVIVIAALFLVTTVQGTVPSVLSALVIDVYEAVEVLALNV